MADNCVDRGENAVRSNHSIDLLPAALVAGRNVQVTFTRDGRQLTVNLNNYNWTDPGGGGSLGTWHYTTNAQEAWKVFAGTSAMATLQGYYQRATAAQLPMGNMSPLLVRAQVTDSNQIPARTTEGLLVITEWFNGTFFQQSKVNRLTAALNRENISHNRNDVDCQRINRGIGAARTMAFLYDCQGFIRKGNSQPIAFIDINWHPTSNSGVESMQADFDAWVR